MHTLNMERRKLSQGLVTDIIRIARIPLPGGVKWVYLVGTCKCYLSHRVVRGSAGPMLAELTMDSLGDMVVADAVVLVLLTAGGTS